MFQRFLSRASEEQTVATYMGDVTAHKVFVVYVYNYIDCQVWPSLDSLY